jgi:hypothetical protein
MTSDTPTLAGGEEAASERATDRGGRTLLTGGAVLVLALLCLPGMTPRWVNLVDGSWVLANSWAHVEGLRWGEHLAYTYGPLGFLRSAMPFTSWLVLGAIAFWICASVSMLWSSLRILGPGPAAWVVAFLAVSIASTVSEIAMPLLGLVLLAVALRLRPVQLDPAVQYGLLGVASALLLLVKFNAGVTSAAVLGVLALSGAQRRRSALGLAAGILAGTVGLWVLSGGRLADIPAFLADSVELAIGYSHALSNGSRTAGAAAVYAAGVALLVTMVGAGWVITRGQPRVWRGGVAAALGILGVSTWMQGFTRFDPGHLAIYFAVVGPACMILVAAAARSWRGGWVLVAGVGLVTAGPLLIALGSPGGGGPISLANPTTLVHPGSSIRNLQDAVTLVLDTSARSSRLELLAGQFAAEAALPADVSAALPGMPAHAEPQAVGAIWAAGGRWRPVPVYQTHMAYTEHLDRRNASSVTDGSTTELVIREDFGLDGTNPLWQSPRLQVEYACRYRENGGDQRWALLVRSDDRCGETRELLTQSVRVDESVAVPASEGLLVAEVSAVGAQDGRLQVRCDDVPYQLMQRLPSGPLIVRMPEALGWTQRTHPLSCERLAFSDDVDITWQETVIGPA